MHSRPHRRFLLAVLLTAVAVWLGVAGSAFADQHKPFNWHIDEISSNSTEVGSHPELTIALATSEDTNEQGLESVKIAWPDGLVPAVEDSEYCVLEQDTEDEGYHCSNPNAKQIGSQGVSYAFTNVMHNIFHEYMGDFGGDSGTLEMSTFLERPRPGEAARLVSIPEEGSDLSAIAFESSAVLRSDGSGVDLTMKGLPFILPPLLLDIGDFFYHHVHPTLHISRIETTVRGDETTASGTPVLTIPATCKPLYFQASFKSYGDDGYAGTGDEVSASQTSPFPITGCESVPYRPSTSLSLTSSQAGETSNLQAEMTIPTGDASPSELSFYLPPGFALVPKEEAAVCTQAEVSTFSCSSASAMGTFSASSTLSGEPLQGTIYQAEPQGDSAGIAVLMRSSFGDIDLAGRLRQTADGGIEMVFPNIPALGIGSVQINLDKGAGGALQNPFACGTYEASSTSTSHTGKQFSATHPLSIVGCKEAEGETALAVKLWKRTSNRYTDIRFDVSQYPSKQVDKATFYLPRQLTVRPPRTEDGPLAYVELWSADKVKRGTLYLAKQTGRSLDLKAKNSRLKGLQVRLDGGARKTGRAKGKRSEKTGGTRVSIQNIPKGSDISDFSLRLFGKRTRLVRTFKKCARDKNLSFKVNVTGEDGRVGEATDKVKVRCERGRVR